MCAASSEPGVLKLVLATGNRGKQREFAALLDPLGLTLQLQSELGIAAAQETGASFEANALIKARHAALLSGLPALADDSGLEVDALDGAPGVHSARFAALGNTENSHDADNNAKLLRLLKDVPLEKRAGRFRCVIALAEINPQSAIRNPQLFDGACEGRIQFAASGQGGFGYDPLFVPDGFSQSFAELGEDVKNQISHRARSLEKVKTFFATK